MILKGNQRAGGQQLAMHLLNTEQNDHVTVLEVSGFATDDPFEAMHEAHAMCQATKAQKYLYSLSLNPPPDADVNIDMLEKAANDAEKTLGLEGQPRMLVLHEKEARLHAHVAWSLIDADEMKKIKIYRDHDKLQELSRQKFLEHDWKMPDGYVNKGLKNPLNFTQNEWQQALRTGQNPKEVKANLQECWTISDNKQSFEQALKSRGYILAKGDRRSYVAVDIFGEVYSLPRQLGKTKKDIEPRLGDANTLPSVTEAKTMIAGQLMDRFRDEHNKLRQKHSLERKPLFAEKKKLVTQQRQERKALIEKQQKRWGEEEIKRSERMRKGFKGIWDRLTGSYQRTRRKNEAETEICHQRDHNEKQQTMKKQIEQRKTLQVKFETLKKSQRIERHSMMKNVHKHLKKLDHQQNLRELFDEQRRDVNNVGLQLEAKQQNFDHEI